jgi:hypothetical protein
VTKEQEINSSAQLMEVGNVAKQLDARSLLLEVQIYAQVMEVVAVVLLKGVRNLLNLPPSFV